MAKTKTDTKPIRAWVVDTGQELKVIFSGNYGDVLAKVGGDPAIQLDERYDQYAGEGKMPFEVLLKDWWTYCRNCGKQVDWNDIENGSATIENDQAVCSGCLDNDDNSFVNEPKCGDNADEIPQELTEPVRDNTGNPAHDCNVRTTTKEKSFDCISKPSRIYGDGICPEHPAGKGNCKGCTFWKEITVKKQELGPSIQDLSTGAKEINYFDPSTNRTYFVSRGWGESPNWIVLYRTGDGTGTHRLKSMKEQDTREQSQAQLDDYAQKKGWEAKQSEVELAQSKCATTFDDKKCVGCVSWFRCYQLQCLKKLSMMPDRKVVQDCPGPDKIMETEDHEAEYDPPDDAIRRPSGWIEIPKLKEGAFQRIFDTQRLTCTECPALRLGVEADGQLVSICLDPNTKRQWSKCRVEQGEPGETESRQTVGEWEKEQVARWNHDEGPSTEDIAGASYSDLITEETAPPGLPESEKDGEEPLQGVCRVCGCTDDHACEGGCHWVEPDLCSKCVTFSCVRPFTKAYGNCPEQLGLDCGGCGLLRWELKGLEPEELAAEALHQQELYEQKIRDQETDAEVGPSLDDSEGLAERILRTSDNQQMNALEQRQEGQVNIADTVKDEVLIQDGVYAGLGQREIPELSARDQEVTEVPAPVQEMLSDMDVFQKIDIGRVYPNSANPRKKYDEADMAELIESVREVGILEPLLVVPDDTGYLNPDSLQVVGDRRYRIVAGERRYRAALATGLQKVPAMIKFLTPDQEFTVMLTENLKRKNLDPLEEAQAFAEARARGWKEEELARKLGISQSQISNRLRLLNLSDPIKELISHEILSAGHGLALIKVAGAPKFAEKVAKNIAEAKVPVNDADKQVEHYVATNGRPLFKSYGGGPLFDPDSFCGKCPSRVLARSYQSGGEHKHPFCIDHACWDKHQEDAQLQKAEELRKKIDERAEEIVGAEGKKTSEVVDLGKLKYEDYEIFQERIVNEGLVNSDDCAGCDFLKPSIGGYNGNGPALVCLKPNCFQEKKKNAESMKNREERRQKKDFEQVKDEIIARGLFDETGQVRRDTLAYMAAEVVENGPYSGLWTRSKIKAELLRQFGWKIDESQDWAEQKADLIRRIEPLDETGLWQVLLFCVLRPAELNSQVYQITLGAKREDADLEGVDAS